MTEKFTHPNAVRKLANGVEVDAAGRFLTGPNPESNPIQSSEDAREMAVRRHTLAKQRAREGLLAAALERGLNVASAEEAWAEVIKVRADVALENRGRDGNDATRLTGKATGFMNEREEGEEERPRQRHYSPEEIEKLLKIARAMDEEIERRAGARRAIDAEAYDADEE